MSEEMHDLETTIDEHTGDSDCTSRIGREVARRVGPRRWDMWFDRSTAFVVEGGRLKVEADSRFVADWIERHFREAIQLAARAELGEHAEVQLDVRARPGTAPSNDDPATPPPPPDRTKARGRRTRTTGRGRRESGPSLEGFEIGDSNRLAYDAACRLGDDLE